MNEWTKFVTEYYKTKKATNKDYQFKDAMKEARLEYKKSGKGASKGAKKDVNAAAEAEMAPAPAAAVVAATEETVAVVVAEADVNHKRAKKPKAHSSKNDKMLVVGGSKTRKHRRNSHKNKK
jgi:hypothetical protein